MIQKEYNAGTPTRLERDCTKLRLEIKEELQLENETSSLLPTFSKNHRHDNVTKRLNNANTLTVLALKMISFLAI